MQMLKLMTRMILYNFLDCSGYYSCMKQALHCQALVGIPDFLTAGENGMHKFSTYICYNLENLTYSFIWDFNPKIFR